MSVVNLEKEIKNKLAEANFEYYPLGKDAIKRVYKFMKMGTITRPVEVNEYIHLGIICLTKGSTDKFISYLEKAVKLKSTDAMNELASYYITIEDQVKEKYYHKLAVKHGDSLAMARLARFYKDTDSIGKKDKIVSLLNKAIAKGNVVSMIYYGELLKEENDLENAEGYYKMAARSNNPVALCHYGQFLQENCRYEEAADMYQKSFALGEEVALYNLARTYTQMGLHDKAIDLMQGRIKSRTKEELARFTEKDNSVMVEICFEAERFDIALEYLNKSLVFKETAMLWLKKTLLHFNTGQEKLMIESAKRCVQLQEYSAYTVLSQYYYLNGNKLQAIRELQKGVDVNSISCICGMGELYNTLGNIPMSIKYYTMAHELGSVEAVLALADIYKESKEYDLMKNYYYIAASFGSSRALFEIGYYHYRIRDYETMILFYKKAIKEGNVDAMYGLGEYYQYIEKDYEKMLDYYHIPSSKSHAPTFHNLALYYKSINEFAQMEQYALAAIMKKFEPSCILLGKYYRSIENYDFMIHYLKKSLKFGGTEGYLLLGIYYAEQSNTDLMLEYFQKGREEKNKDCIIKLAIYYAGEGDVKESMDLFNEARDLGKTCYFEMASVLLAQEVEKEDVDENIDKAIELFHQGATEGDAQCILYMAEYYQTLGLTTKAEKYYEMASQSTSPLALFNAAYFYQDLKDYTRALKCFQLAHEHGHPKASTSIGFYYQYINYDPKLLVKFYKMNDETDDIAMINLAGHYWSLEKYNKAIVLYNRAIKRFNSSKAMYFLGILYDRLDQIQLAREFYQKAIDHREYNAQIYLDMSYIRREQQVF